MTQSMSWLNWIQWQLQLTIKCVLNGESLAGKSPMVEPWVENIKEGNKLNKTGRHTMLPGELLTRNYAIASMNLCKTSVIRQKVSQIHQGCTKLLHKANTASLGMLSLPSCQWTTALEEAHKHWLKLDYYDACTSNHNSEGWNLYHHGNCFMWITTRWRLVTNLVTAC